MYCSVFTAFGFASSRRNVIEINPQICCVFFRIRSVLKKKKNYLGGVKSEGVYKQHVRYTKAAYGTVGGRVLLTDCCFLLYFYHYLRPFFLKNQLNRAQCIMARVYTFAYYSTLSCAESKYNNDEYTTFVCANNKPPSGPLFCTIKARNYYDFIYIGKKIIILVHYYVLTTSAVVTVRAACRKTPKAGANIIFNLMFND